MPELEEFRYPIGPNQILYVCISDESVTAEIQNTQTGQTQKFNSPGVGNLNFCRFSDKEVIFPDGTQVDPDGTVHFTNGIVAKLTGEPNTYEFFKPDGTKID